MNGHEELVRDLVSAGLATLADRARGGEFASGAGEEILVGLLMDAEALGPASQGGASASDVQVLMQGCLSGQYRRA